MANAVEITDKNFDELIKSSKIVLVDFWAKWCGPCKAIAPIIDELAGEYAGKIIFGKLDIDSNGVSTTKFKVMNIPTLLIFKNGELVDTIVGAPTKAKLVERLALQL